MHHFAMVAAHLADSLCAAGLHPDTITEIFEPSRRWPAKSHRRTSKRSSEHRFKLRRACGSPRISGRLIAQTARSANPLHQFGKSARMPRAA